MSTRAMIGFYEKKEFVLKDVQIVIYRHFDGYPEGVLKDIVPILKDFDKNRGLDSVEYSAAWLVAKLKDNYLNIGICYNPDNHSDVEYYYAVTPYEVVVYRVCYSFDFDKLQEIRRVNLKGAVEWDLMDWMLPKKFA